MDRGPACRVARLKPAFAAATSIVWVFFRIMKSLLWRSVTWRPGTAALSSDSGKHKCCPTGHRRQEVQGGIFAWRRPETPVGLRPPSVPARRLPSHPDCRASLILIAAPHPEPLLYSPHSARRRRRGGRAERRYEWPQGARRSRVGERVSCACRNRFGHHRLCIKSDMTIWKRARIAFSPGWRPSATTLRPAIQTSRSAEPAFVKTQASSNVSGRCAASVG